MQTKHKIDRDTRTLILKYIRKYDEYKRWCNAERERIYQPGRTIGEPVQTGAPSDPTLAAAEALERLENCHRAQVVRAIEGSRERIGVTYESAEARRRLVNAIWLSCLDGWRWNYHAFDGIVPCSEREFYYEKNRFIVAIRRELEI